MDRIGTWGLHPYFGSSDPKYGSMGTWGPDLRFHPWDPEDPKWIEFIMDAYSDPRD